MALSLLNRLDSEGELHSKENSLRAIGCRDCGAIYDLSTYISGSDEAGRLCGSFCPDCSSYKVRVLGVLPRLVEDEGEWFLVGNDEETITGPYKTEAEAQSSLWDWFNSRETNDSGQNEESNIVRLVFSNEEEGDAEEKEEAGKAAKESGGEEANEKEGK
jgi:hypothetical protein